MAVVALLPDDQAMTKLLKDMTRTDWLTRRWVNTTPPGSAEMMFTDDGDFPEAQRRALLDVLLGRPDAEHGSDHGRNADSERPAAMPLR
jgi:hypothetical protein